MLEKMKVALVRLGCDKNEVDADIMAGIMIENGYEIISDPSCADVIIVNSCGFIQAAKEESIEHILRSIEYKKHGLARFIIVTGCLAQRYGDELKKVIPEVDAFIGTGNIDNIGEVLAALTHAQQTIIRLDKPHISQMFEKRLMVPSGHTAYVKIAEGCNSGCSYCIIPQLRGRYQSRSIDSIYHEVVALAAKGVKEIILVAQDTTLYGHDIYGTPSLVPLLKRLLEVQGIRWFRLLYCYPTHISTDLLDLMATQERIAKYLDIPLQHADAGILQQMRRPGIDRVNVPWLQSIRRKIPNITLRTTMIVGFPGETEEAFQQLLSFINEVCFDHLGVFQYSQEEGTLAATMSNQVEEGEKRIRAVELMEEQRLISWSRNQRYIGKTIPVMLEKPLEQDIWIGRGEKDAPEIDGLCYIKVNQPVKSGDIIKVRIEEAHEFDLKGCMTDYE